jgi:hypothetical protein
MSHRPNPLAVVTQGRASARLEMNATSKTLTPSEILGSCRKMAVYQKMICTNSGVLRTVST